MELDEQLELKKRADSGDVEAIYDYGVFLYFERSEPELALNYLLDAASKNYELAYGDIAIIYSYEKNAIETAEKWFKKAEQADCLFPWAAYEYGLLLYIEKDDDKAALKYFYLAAEEDYEPAFGLIGTIFYHNLHDPETAEKWFEKAEQADCLYAPVAYQYGMLNYLEREDVDAALKYLNKAAAEEYELAYGEIGIILVNYKDDSINAEKWFEKAEQANCLFAPAAYEYGMLFLKKGDEAKAMEYLLEAANDNYPLACEELGEIFYQRNDLKTSEMWYQRAAELQE